MQETVLDEAIQVRADFAGGQVTPRMYKRHGKVSVINSVNTRWRDDDGSFPVFCFSVERDDGCTCYLRFDTGRMQWRLEQVIVP